MDKKHPILLCHFANTFVGKKGNIGVRTAKLLCRENGQEFVVSCFARGYSGQFSQVECSDMWVFGHVARILNAIRIYVIPNFNHRLIDIRLFEWFSILFSKKKLASKGVDVAHVWDSCPNLIKSLQKLGIKVILDVPIAPTTYGRRINEIVSDNFLLDDNKIIDVELAAYTAADRILAPSEFVANELVLAGVNRDKITVVEFGSDAPLTPLIELSSRKMDGTFDFCIAGALGKRKGVYELLEAWSDPCFSNDRLHLFGRLYPDVARKIVEMKFANIIVHGFVDLDEYLHKYDFFVLPSWLEGSAKVVYEAMAHGLPCIVSDSTGSIIRDSIDGFVTKPGDVKTLKNSMLWLKQNPVEAKEMGIRARERVSQFTWNRYVERVHQVYRDVLG